MLLQQPRFGFALRLWNFSDFCSRHTVGVAGDDIMLHILVYSVQRITEGNLLPRYAYAYTLTHSPPEYVDVNQMWILKLISQLNTLGVFYRIASGTWHSI